MGCKFCGRCIENRGSLVSHQFTCVANPDKIVYGKSVGAGGKIGCVAPNKGKKTGYPAAVREKYPNERMFSENCSVARHAVKKRILLDDLIENVCDICGIGPEWNDKPMVLILDHINGVNNDNRLENLRFVCSNCDSQLDTYKAKNKGNHKEVVVQ